MTGKSTIYSAEEDSDSMQLAPFLTAFRHIKFKNPQLLDASRDVLVASVAVALLFFAGAVYPAQRQKHAYIQIEGDAASQLCVSASNAVRGLREGMNDRLFAKFRDPRTRSTTDLQVEGLTFHALRTKKFTTVDEAAVERTREVAFYQLDLDNDGSREMITLVTGGHGAAGDGDTLYILENDLVQAPQPVRNDEFIKVRLEIGGRTHSFYGKDLTFDPAYYMYPFAFQGKNYLLIEGNRSATRPHFIVALVAEAGISSRCYF